jgi:hypothetical protein
MSRFRGITARFAPPAAGMTAGGANKISYHPSSVTGLPFIFP